MTTQIRSLYGILKHFSTATHQSICGDFLRCTTLIGTKPTIAEWFAEAVASNNSFCNVDQPFIGVQSLSGRTPTAPDSKRTRIIHLLASKAEIEIGDGSQDYRFTYMNRELSPLRIEKANQPSSGAGGIDYIGRTKGRPILGEIKVDNDANPFYAFVQLLTYLSELATPHQIQRANRHKEFGLELGVPQAFDLHILLADFNDRGEKGELIEPTKRLAEQFKERLHARHPEAAAYVGNILCIGMNSHAFAESNTANLKCIWAA